MDVWKYEIISRVVQDIPLVRHVHLWDTVSWSALKINFISRTSLYCIILYVQDIQTVCI